MSIALSWSRLSDYDQCPRKFFLKYIEKSFPKEDASKSPHLVKGAEMHKQMEQYVYRRLNGQPTDQAEFQMVPACRDATGIIERTMMQFPEVWPERQVAVTYDWKPTEWFGKDVAWRAIWDFSGVHAAARQAMIIDWKTGKVQDYEDEAGQLHLSAAMAVPVYNVDEVYIFYAFIEHRVKKPKEPLTINSTEATHLKGYFNQKYDKVNQEKEWKPQVNQYCNWCPATKAQCPFSRK